MEHGHETEFEYARKWTSQLNYIKFVWRTCHEPFCASMQGQDSDRGQTVLGRVPYGSQRDSALVRLVNYTLSTPNYTN
jgi:hypothetical protein